MAKFRWTKDAGVNWTVVEASLPYNIAGVVASDTVIVEPIGDAVTEQPTTLTFAQRVMQYENPWSTTTYLWRNFATGGYLANEHVIAVPFGNDRRFAMFGFRNWGGSTVINLGRFYEGIAARFVHHNSGAVTKTGTGWSTGGTTTGAYKGGSVCNSAVAGDTIYTTISGTGFGLILPRVSVNGFCKVSIDGDFTAANMLPAVGDAEISAGWFSESDRGHRYFEPYDQQTDYDFHLPLVEGLADGNHTILIRVMGTKHLGSLTRIYVVGFVAWDKTEVPGVNGAFLFKFRGITQSAVDGYSAQTCAMAFNPSGYSNPQYVGENHGYETQVSATWKVDGSPVVLSSDQYTSGTTVNFEIVNTLTHPSISPTKVADKLLTYTASASQQLQLTADIDITWQYAGTITQSYWGMLTSNYFSYFNLVFNKYLIDTYEYEIHTDDASSGFGQIQSTPIIAYNDLHNTVIALHVPDITETLENWVNSNPWNAFVNHTINSNDKCYFTRSTDSNPVIVDVSDTQSGKVGWRITRVSQ